MRLVLFGAILFVAFVMIVDSSDSPEVQAKRDDCAASCVVFDQCGFELKGLSTIACIDQCVEQTTNEWSECVNRHSEEYGCCAEALDYCSQFLH